MKPKNNAKARTINTSRQRVKVARLTTFTQRQKTCERIAEENGISSRSVCRAEAFSKAVDIADSVEPGMRSELLAGEIKATEKDIRELVDCRSRKNAPRSLSAYANRRRKTSRVRNHRNQILRKPS